MIVGKVFTHEDLVKKFGVGFVYTSYDKKIRQVFRHDGEYSDIFVTVEDVHRSLEEESHRTYDRRMKYLWDFVEEYNKLPLHKKVVSFLFRGYWNKNKVIKEYEEERQTELTKDLRSSEDVVLEMLDTGALYILSAPEVTDGQKVYISVTQDNYLGAGVHVATVSDMRWFVNTDNKTVTYDARMQTGKFVMSLSTQEGEARLRSGYTYHEVHLDMQDAIDRVQQHIKKVAEDFEKVKRTLMEEKK